MGPDLDAQERIAITGIGLVSPIGTCLADAWERCIHGDSGIGPCTRFETSGYPCQSAGQVPPYSLENLRAPKNQKFMNTGARHLMHAAQHALASSSVQLSSLEPSRVAVHIASGRIGPEPSEFFRAFSVAHNPDGSPDWDQLGGTPSRLVDPYFPLRTLSNSGAALLAIEICARGPSANFVQSDIASALALDAACRDLEEDRCDLAIAGGFDFLVTPASYLNLHQHGLLSAKTPEEALRPFDQEADGLVPGEGAVALILERVSDARKRSAPILAEIAGVATSASDSHCLGPFSAPAMSAVVRRATSGDDIDFLVASGFGLPEADQQEATILSDVVGNQVPVTAFKSLTGYLGAATALAELALGVMALDQRLIPPVARHRQLAKGININVISRPIPLESTRPHSALLMSNTWTGQAAAIYVKTAAG
jgi:3-oxoacyl-[acyl-carrier-protein] synthase II